MISILTLCHISFNNKGHGRQVYHLLSLSELSTKKGIQKKGIQKYLNVRCPTFGGRSFSYKAPTFTKNHLVAFLSHFETSVSLFCFFLLAEGFLFSIMIKR